MPSFSVKMHNMQQLWLRAKPGEKVSNGTQDTDKRNHYGGSEQAGSLLVERTPEHVKLLNGFCGYDAEDP